LCSLLTNETVEVIALISSGIEYSIKYCLCILLTYKLLHSQALSYLGPLVSVADVPGRRALRSANTDHLMVPHLRLSSVGNRASPVAAPCVWNSLSSEVTSAKSLHSFRRHLKTFLLQRSLPDVIVTL